jgi:prepilin-type N-terminal cleavage/methylation domain-containing protein
VTATRGVTLIELLVTLSLLAILSAVTTLAVRQIGKPRPHDPRAILADSIRVVLESGRPTTVNFIIDGIATSATIRPDGSVMADSLLDLEPLSGRFTHAR